MSGLHNAEWTFWSVLIASFILPFTIYGTLLAKQAISRTTVLIFGFLMVAIAGLDFYLLKRLSNFAHEYLPLNPDSFFNSEISIALYLLSALFAGIGINMVSHVLTRHLDDAERRFKSELKHKPHQK